jgi:hypothetical protein
MHPVRAVARECEFEEPVGVVRDRRRKGEARAQVRVRTGAVQRGPVDERERERDEVPRVRSHGDKVQGGVQPPVLLQRQDSVQLPGQVHPCFFWGGGI